MVVHSIALIAAILHLTNSGVQDEVVLVEGHQSHKSRVHRSHRRYNEGKAYDISREVNYKPMDGRLGVTKGIHYVNGKSEMDNYVYESILLNEDQGVEEVDPFFVTRPPQRTTLAVKYNSLDNQFLYGKERSKEEASGVELKNKKSTKSTTRSKVSLRLVTIPPMSTTPLSPFKYRRPYPRKAEYVSSSALMVYGFGPHSDELRKTTTFTTIPQQGILNLNQNSLTSTNPLHPIIPVNELNITNSLLPVRSTDSKPIPFPSQSTFRKASHTPNKDSVIVPFSSVTAPIEGNAYNDTPSAGSVKKIPITADYSVDGTIMEAVHRVVAAKAPLPSKRIGSRNLLDQELASFSKPISGPYRGHHDEEDGLGQLRIFARNHLTILKDLEKPKPVKENELPYPKHYNASYQAPSASRAKNSFTDNDKLSLCCRKKGVNQRCQSMCNYDALDERSIVFGFLTNVCPGPQLGYAFECASSKVDHSECCERAGIQNFLTGRCMPFCRAYTALPANPLQFLPCLQVFEPIKNCYRDYKSTHSNIIKD